MCLFVNVKFVFSYHHDDFLVNEVYQEKTANFFYKANTNSKNSKNNIYRKGSIFVNLTHNLVIILK